MFGGPGGMEDFMGNDYVISDFPLTYEGSLHGKMIFGRSGFRRLARILEMILYEMLQRLIGQK